MHILITLYLVSIWFFFSLMCWCLKSKNYRTRHWFTYSIGDPSTISIVCDLGKLVLPNIFSHFFFFFCGYFIAIYTSVFTDNRGEGDRLSEFFFLFFFFTPARVSMARHGRFPRADGRGGNR